MEERVIPVRIDIENDHYRLKDTFLWNCAGEYESSPKMSPDG